MEESKRRKGDVLLYHDLFAFLRERGHRLIHTSCADASMAEVTATSKTRGKGLTKENNPLSPNILHMVPSENRIGFPGPKENSI